MKHRAAALRQRSEALAHVAAGDSDRAFVARAASALDIADGALLAFGAMERPELLRTAADALEAADQQLTAAAAALVRFNGELEVVG